MTSLDRVFSRYTGWKVLNWFVVHPSEEIHVKRLARELDISSGSASRLLSEFHGAGLLTRRKEANALLYSLDNENPIIHQLKRLNTIMLLADGMVGEKFLEIDDTIISIAIYGSHASGENHRYSDIDVLIITGSRNKRYTLVLAAIELLFGCEASLLTYSLSGWKKLKEDDRNFYETILSDHVILYGSRLP